MEVCELIILMEIFYILLILFSFCRLVDVGGQRNERKKWIHCFEDVTAIIFFADASAYNLTLFEDERVNRLLEALTLFEEICNCKYFHATPLILFLNKSDLLKKKIRKVDIADYFEDYNGIFLLFNNNRNTLTYFFYLNRW